MGEEEAARKKAEEVAALRKHAEEVAAARKKAAEAAEARKRAKEMTALRKKAEEVAALGKAEAARKKAEVSKKSPPDTMTKVKKVIKDLHAVSKMGSAATNIAKKAKENHKK